MTITTRRTQYRAVESTGNSKCKSNRKTNISEFRKQRYRSCVSNDVDPDECVQNNEIAGKMERAKRWHNHFALVAGTKANIAGNAQTIRETGATPGFVKYYKQKVANAGFHPGTVGGARNCRFDETNQRRVEQLLFDELKREPRQTAAELATFLGRHLYYADDRWVQAVACPWSAAFRHFLGTRNAWCL
jgi:hypothetical protein